MTSANKIIPGQSDSVCTLFTGANYTDLFAHYAEDGIVTIRWQLNWKERLQILFSGSIWHQIMTFKEPLQPIKLTTICPLKVEENG